MKIGKLSTALFFGALFMSGCSNVLIFGHNDGFCDDCGFENKGVCANPADVFRNRELVLHKSATCDKSDKYHRDGRDRPEVVVNSEEYDD